MKIKTKKELEEEKKLKKKIEGMDITYEYVKNKIRKMITTEKKEKGLNKEDKYEREEKINTSLNRIYIDRALYSKYTCSLATILLKVWTYIHNHENEEEMKKRLLQELEDMSGTCSSGFASRLINSITGFGDFSLRISWRDQIIANLNGRLNARARQIDDLAFQEKVLVEMTINTRDYKSRRHFLKFFRKNLLSIREEMWEEFREHITDIDYDLYFRQSISQYESGGYI